MENKTLIIDKKRKFQIYLFAGLTFLTIFVIHILLIFGRWLDNDVYFYLGLGKYIWTNKIIPDYHPYFIGGHIDNMIPQWLYNVVVYLINEKAGYPGLFIFMLFWEFLGAFFLYKIARLKKCDTIASILLILMVYYMDTGIVTIRTNLMTLALATIQIYLLEKYKDGNRIRYLIPLPFISLLEMNAHMALWLIHICIMAAYIFPQISLPFGFSKHTYKLKPLICFTVLMAGAGLINPYGLKAVFFIKEGISEETMMIVQEMQPLPILSGEGLGIILCSVVILLMMIKKQTSYEFFYLFIGLVFLSVNQSRNMYWGYLAISVIAFELLKEKQFMTQYARFVPKKVTGYAPFIIFALVIFICHPAIYGTGFNPNAEYEKNMDELIGMIEADPSHSDNIFNDMGMGNYLEYKGYNIYVDTRMDGYMPGFTGGLDILSDYIYLNYAASEKDYRELENQYDFDYAIVNTYGRIALYMEMSGDYELVAQKSMANIPESLNTDISLFRKK